MGRKLGSKEGQEASYWKEIAEMLELYVKGCSEAQIARCQGKNRQTIHERLKHFRLHLIGLDKIIAVSQKRSVFLSAFEARLLKSAASDERLEKLTFGQITSLLNKLNKAQSRA